MKFIHKLHRNKYNKKSYYIECYYKKYRVYSPMAISKVLKIPQNEYINDLLECGAVYITDLGYGFKFESEAKFAAEYLNTKYSVLFNIL